MELPERELERPELELRREDPELEPFELRREDPELELFELRREELLELERPELELPECELLERELERPELELRREEELEELRPLEPPLLPPRRAGATLRPIAVVKLELDWLLLTEPLEIELTAVRTTLAPALGTHRHTAAAVAKASKACLRSGLFNLAADMGKNVLTAIPEVVVI